MTTQRSSRLPATRTVLVVFAFAFLVFANTLGNDFVWDDRNLIADNPLIRTLDAETLGRIMTENYWRDYAGAGSYYRPLVTLSYHIDYQLFDGNPAGYHWVNVILNALVCAAVFLFLRRVFDDGVAVVAALLFAAHPLHAENVAWISGRTDLLAALWVLCSWTLYVVYKQSRGPAALGGALLCFLLALLCKESVIFAPLVIATIEFGPITGRDGRKPQRGVAVAAFFAIAGSYLMWRLWVLGSAFGAYERYTDSAAGAVALPFSILAGYVLKLIAPLSLNTEYDAPVPSSLFDVHAVTGIAIVVAVAACAWRWRKNPAVVLGSILLVGGWLPVANIIPIGEISAERFLYIPSLGFVLILAWWLNRSWTRRRSPAVWTRLGVFIVPLLFVGWTARTVVRNADWKDQISLFTSAAQGAPNDARAQFNLASALHRDGRVADAIPYYKRTLAIDPDYPDALAALGGIYLKEGRVDDALPLYERVVAIEPDRPELLTHLGLLYYQKRRYYDAAHQFKRILSIDPNDQNAHYNLGLIRYQEGDQDAAERHFERVAGKHPRYVLAYYHLAIIEYNKGDFPRAKLNAQQFLSRYRKDDKFRKQILDLLPRLSG